MALDDEFKTFVIYIAALKAPLARILIYFLRKAQIAALKQDQAPTKVSAKYAN